MERAKGVWKMTADSRDTTGDITDTTEGIQGATDDMCARGLIRAARKNCPRNDNEEVE